MIQLLLYWFHNYSNSELICHWLFHFKNKSLPSTNHSCEFDVVKHPGDPSPTLKQSSESGKSAHHTRSTYIKISSTKENTMKHPPGFTLNTYDLRFLPLSASKWNFCNPNHHEWTLWFVVVIHIVTQSVGSFAQPKKHKRPWDIFVSLLLINIKAVDGWTWTIFSSVLQVNKIRPNASNRSAAHAAQAQQTKH